MLEHEGHLAFGIGLYCAWLALGSWPVMLEMMMGMVLNVGCWCWC